MSNEAKIQALGREFRNLVKDFDIHPCYKSFHTTPQHDGSPHIEMEGDEYCFVVTERGQEYERIRSLDPDEILYLLVEGVTSVVATKFELENRVSDQDGRRIWFLYQQRLLYEMKPDWGLRKREDHERILKTAPFDDMAWKTVSEDNNPRQ